MNTSFGWTVVRNPRSTLNGKLTTGRAPYHVYERDRPADREHGTEDLAPFTYPSERKAIEAGRRGEYAYKR